MIAVVTNIDADHMETYGQDFGKLTRAFVDFVQRLPFYGVAVLCADDPHVRAILPEIAKPVVTYGLAADAQVRAVDVDERRRTDALRARKATRRAPMPVELALAGVHNVQNALAAIAVGTRSWASPTRRSRGRSPNSRASAGASSATATSSSRPAARSR